MQGCHGRVCWAMAVVALLAGAARAEVTPQQAWQNEYNELEGLIRQAHSAPPARRERLKAEALDEQALISPQDKDPLDVVLRRTGALVGHLAGRRLAAEGVINEWRRQLAAMMEEAAKAGAERRRALYGEVCALRRRVALANPLVDFDRIICMVEQPGERRIIEQARAAYGFRARGGGPLLVENVGKEGGARSGALLAGVKVSSGPWRGKELTGYFSGLELTWDGKALLFAATTDSDIWHIFRFNLETKELAQLTDGPADDFDPCELPSGRIVFTSTRRGGIGRCVLLHESLTYTLHSMEADGSDIVCLSFHETNEWAPSVNHQGKLVYTRWDYMDRHWGTAHHFWECFPDGRDPRNLHGNYPLPWTAMPEGLQPEQYGKPHGVNGRFLRPDAEISFRAVPGSPRYTGTAVGHHEGFSGSLFLLDPRIPDDGKMAQLKRITPEYAFPETEDGPHVWGTAWPLSDHFYLCNYQSGLYLLDRFGNREVIYDPGAGPYRVRDPFPLRARPMPAALPVMTWQGKRSTLPDHRRAVISIMDVYASDVAGQMPEGLKAKWLRVVQVIPQLLDNQFSLESVSQISFASDSIGRMPLGIVPVEEDGSVYFEAPVGKALYFQLLDEKGMAIHSMRSVTYVHPGEHLSCIGCHEDKWKPTRQYGMPKALRRAPSQLVAEVASGAAPFNYIQLVKKPVFDPKCVSCHQQNRNAPDMSYASLARYDRAFSYPGEPGLHLLGVGASRTTPGRFGARASGIMKTLGDAHHKDVKLTADEMRRLTLWLDLNSNEIGWIGNDRAQIAAQKQGTALWPPVDVDPQNVTGVERDVPLGR